MAGTGFRLANDTPTQKMYIPNTTVVEHGEVVVFTPGTGIAAGAPTDLDNPSVGCANEAHASGDGTEIVIASAPNAKFSHINRNAITASGGSTTTFVDSSILPATDDVFNGGYLEIVACAADSSLNGKMIEITNFTGTGGTFTFAEQSGAFASGDTAYLHPGKLAVGEYGWDLDSDGMNIDYETSAGEGLVIVDAHPELKTVIVQFRLHQFGNGPAAL